MVSQGTPLSGLKSNRILLLLAALTAPLSSCSSQDPAFVEKSFGGPEGAGSAQASELDSASSMNSTAASSEGGLNSETQAANDESDKMASDAKDNEAQSLKGGSISGSESDTALEPVTMTYKQATNSLVDILWIIDTSGSMKEEQDYLGTNFNSFISGLAKSNLNFQTAITSTDICQDKQPKNLEDVVCPGESLGHGNTHLRGSFVGQTGRKVLKHSDADLVEKFNQYTAMGINGSGFEHGLKAADLAIAKVITGENENLIRNEAFLAVIVVSDEEDDGIGLGMKDAYSDKNFVELGMTKFHYSDKDFSAYLKTIKGDGKFSVSTITGTRGKNGKLCTSPHSQPAEEGTQYINAAKATGGIVQSICDTDWDQSLFKIGHDIEAQISQISLERTPAMGSIKVYVNDVLTSKWTYLEGTKVLKFLPDAIPQDGATIRIEFLALPAA